MGDNKLQINELFRLLRNRPKMLISGDIDSILTYITFFEGFFLSYQISKNINLEREISKSYQNHVETKAPNMYWFAHFKLINKNETDKEKISILLNDLEFFFNSNTKIL